LIAQVINVAIKTWRYDLPRSPMQGVRRPKYFNERNRRLQGDEQERLLRAARREDLLRSRRAAVEELLGPARAQAGKLPNDTARKRFLTIARKRATRQLRRSYAIVPLYETFIAFLLETAARRGEALALLWQDVRLEDQTAFFPETKNDRSRTVPVQRFTSELLATLPRAEDRVFPMSIGSLKGAWRRICQRARLNDYHMHDLRHEGLSRIAEAGHNAGQHFTLIDLAAISGHRDLRMLARYANLCARHLAKRLDAAFATAGVALTGGQRSGHKGRRRLGGTDGVSVREVLSPPTPLGPASTPSAIRVHDLPATPNHVENTPSV
jgi:integrase